MKKPPKDTLTLTLKATTPDAIERLFRGLASVLTVSELKALQKKIRVEWDVQYEKEMLRLEKKYSAREQ